jgi:hypothetical protein
MRLQEIEARNTEEVNAAIQFALRKYRRNGVAIYKGSDNYGTEPGVFYRDPTAHAQPRISANTQNYTTLWVDGDPRWSKFPPRSRSLICTTYADTAASFGDVAVVIPLQDTKIGVCPEQDFWDSFSETIPGGYSSIPSLNAFIDHTIRKQLKRKLNQKTLTRDGMLNILDKLTVDDLLDKKALPSYVQYYGLSDKEAFVAQVQQYGWRGMMEVMLNPKINGFKLTTWKQFNIAGDHEVWLSAPCAMVPIDVWEKLANS